MSTFRVTLAAATVVLLCLGAGPCVPDIPNPGKATISVINGASVDAVGFYLTDPDKTAEKAVNLLPATIPPGGRYDGIQVPSGTQDAALVLAQTDPDLPGELLSEGVPLANGGSYEFVGSDVGMAVSVDAIPGSALASLQFSGTHWRTSSIWDTSSGPSPLPQLKSYKRIDFWFWHDGHYDFGVHKAKAQEAWSYDPLTGVLTLTNYFEEEFDLTIVGYVNPHHISVSSLWGTFALRYIEPFNIY